MKMISVAVVATTLLAGCQSAPPQQSAASQSSEPLMATAVLKSTKGNKAFGEATFEQEGDKVHVLVNVQGLKPGAEHGFHIHEVGDCSADDGSSAKGHFNPAGKAHGNPATTEHHAGDLPALKAGKDGRAKLDTLISGVTLGPGPTSIMGRGLVIHADPDDYTSQPAGNSGARVACGVIRAS
jgi:superoxide dismutase, Cu-Zn family